MLRLVFSLAALASLAYGSGHGKANFIIGGRNVSISEVPYMVSFEENGRPECGGAIISEEWVLTAAHCRVNDRDKGLFRTGSEIKGYGGVIHEILEEVVHPEFSAQRHNDFALYRVYPRFAFNSKTARVNLPDFGDDVPISSNAIFSGWGHTTRGSPNKDLWQLQSVNRTVTCPEVCILQYGNKHNLDTTICVKAAQGVALCEGDEGGPLVVNNVLVGVATWQTATCRGDGKPSIFEKVEHVRHWIRAVAKV